MSPPGLDQWSPISIREVIELFEGAPFRWWVSGGHALELHTGQSWREHGDLDIGVVRHESEQWFEWLAGWDLWMASRGSLTPWHGQPLDDVPEVNNVWARRPSDPSWRIDLAVDGGDESDWIYRRVPTIRRSWADAVLRTSDGVPYLAPDLQLLFKAKNARPRDDHDARVVIPLLDGEQRLFLKDHLDEGHEWREWLA